MLMDPVDGPILASLLGIESLPKHHTSPCLHQGYPNPFLKGS